MIKAIQLVFVIIIISIAGCSQEKELSWEEISNQYEIPDWFTEARFGVWVHWGAQTVPEYGGGWYARHMYMQDVGKQTFGRNAYPYHLNPS